MNYQKLLQPITKEAAMLQAPAAFYNTNNHYDLYLALEYFRIHQTTVVLVVKDLIACYDIYRKAQTIIPEQVLMYARDEVIRAELLAVSPELKRMRLQTIDTLIRDATPHVIITHPAALAKPIAPLQEVQSHYLHLEINQTINRPAVIRHLLECGYERVPFTTAPGEFSVRGGIIDIYAPNYAQPIRIDFFDTIVESLKSFDPDSQRTLEAFEAVTIQPMSEFLYIIPERVTETLMERIGDEAVKYDLEFDVTHERLEKYSEYLNVNSVLFSDYLDDAVIFLSNYSAIRATWKTIVDDATVFLQKFGNHIKMMIAKPEVDWSNYRVVATMPFLIQLPFPIKALIDAHSYELPDFHNDLNQINGFLLKQTKPIVIGYHHESYLAPLKKILDNFGDASWVQNVTLLYEPRLYALQLDNVIILTAREFLAWANPAPKVVFDFAPQIIESVDELAVGSLVVHRDYGIARYLGIETVELKSSRSDYIALEFRDQNLYIPVEAVNQLGRYIGLDSETVQLSRIKTPEWQRKKRAVEAEVQQLALQLFELYQSRMNLQGIVFPPDDEVLRAFEADFDYELTPDQASAIEIIKAEMEAGKVIDRLICGEVGFGKTEIALRAAMKTVLAGYQVIYMAPTTILTRQHFETFQRRCEPYGVKVAELSRFITKTHADQTVRDFNEGEIDILIGTHAVLNSRINYDKLGLIIIDEEQRFGVVHKEKIQLLRKSVNVLTMTATPIPRTLNMALTKFRDLSHITTPPQDRYPVQTMVLQHEPLIVRDAILKELARGGQVFFMENFIQNLNHYGAEIAQLVPEARIAVLHGQMAKNDIENILQDFIDKKYDVLIATTIIETGIDMPDVNTLIVSSSERLGLAQMHQLRGRVGRSNKVAFAYFMYRPGQVLTDNAQMRLQAIRRYSALGSGYQIALEDLAIRGAGNFFGKQQSGAISAVGLELYTEMLNDVLVTLEKPKKLTEQPKPLGDNLHIEVDRTIDDSYVKEDAAKMYIYKRINEVDSFETREAVVNELIDRFGPLSPSLENYLDAQLLTQLFKQYGVVSFNETNNEVKFRFDPKATTGLKGQKLFASLGDLVSNLSLAMKNKSLEVTIPKQHSKAKQYLPIALEFFRRYQSYLDAK